MALLTREQIKSLEKRLETLKISRESLSESLAEEVKDFKISSGDSITSSILTSRETLAAMDREMNEISNLLATAKVPEYDAEKIEVGTNFTAAVDVEGKIREEKYTLVESNPNFDDEEYMQISITSPFGAAVKGKRTNEVFEYQAPAGKFKCVITSIEPVKEVSQEITNAKQKTIGTHPSMKRGK